MFQHDSFFFIGVFVFIFIFWVVVGGPTHPISFSGPLLSAPGALGGGTYLSLPQAPQIGGVEVGQSHATGVSYQQTQGQISSLNNQVNQLKTNVNQTVAFGSPSPYRNIVSMSHGVNGAGNTNPQNEYIQIYMSSNTSGPINISGWTLKSEATGNSMSIPQGTEVPMSGVINAIQNVVLNPGDRAIVISGRSPIGASFRENKCIGYFAQFQSFSPSLSNACPTPAAELTQFYGPNLIRDASCIDYADRLPRCTITLSPPANLSSTCQTVISTQLNYNGCVSGHQNDFDFKSPTWRVYLSRTTTMWRSTHESVKLLDADGKTVDAFTY